MAKQLHPQQMKLAGNGCKMKILTMGLPTKDIVGVCNEWCRGYFMFANYKHVDKRDAMLVAERDGHLNNPCLSSHLRRLLSFNGYSLPTMCGHQLLLPCGLPKDVRTKIFKSFTLIFSMEGLGVGMSVDNGTAHLFMGSAFLHRTCVGVYRSESGVVTVANRDPNALRCFAWGSAGSSSTRRMGFEDAIVDAVAEHMIHTTQQWSQETVEGAIEFGMELYSTGVVARENAEPEDLGAFVVGMIAASQPILDFADVDDDSDGNGNGINVVDRGAPEAVDDDTGNGDDQRYSGDDDTDESEDEGNPIVNDIHNMFI